jgi:NAD(P)-dependent dehydrogenase (short-subunit alcohol dehydrogenase family)
MPKNRVVVTGSSGRLGHTLVERFRSRGFQVLGVDRVEFAGDPTTVVAELSDEAAIAAAMRADDIVVHVASMHGFSEAALQHGGLSDQAYIDLNVAGTWHLYKAIAAAGVRAVILTSTVGVLGRIPDGRLSTISLDDRFPSFGIYGTTKRFQEDTAQSFALSSGISTLAIRPPAFVSVDPVRDVYLLAMGALDIEDVVGVHESAVMAARDHRILPTPGSFDAVFAAPSLPYRRADEPLLNELDGRLRLVERYWPGTTSWFEAQGFDPEQGLNIAPCVFDVQPAKRLLGWQAQKTFDAWYATNLQSAG